VRFADPEPHLRVRLHGDPAALLGPFLRHVCDWAGELRRDGLCHRFAFDTYDREVERYGGEEGMRAAEALFYADSSAVCSMLRLAHEGDLPFDLTTSLAVLSVDELLAAVNLDVAQRLTLYTDAAPLTRAGGKSTADARPSCVHCLPRAPLNRVFAGPRAARVTVPNLRVARSHVHMHLNRLLADGPAEERVLELLRRTRTGLDRSS
jgi:hypothetical protein